KRQKPPARGDLVRKKAPKGKLILDDPFGDDDASHDVFRPLPRRKFGKPILVDIPVDRTVVKLEKNFFPSVKRCFVWFMAFMRFALGNLWDRLLGTDNMERRAQRLLKIFQGVGGTIIKIGQQLSVRVDMLPHAYCRELGKLLDSVPP